MARYIDADALASVIDTKGEIALGTPKEVFLSVAKMIKLFPTSDVIEVVRCKDCQHFTGKAYDGYCIANSLATRYANDFCSNGERKANDRN